MKRREMRKHKNPRCMTFLSCSFFSLFAHSFILSRCRHCQRKDVLLAVATRQLARHFGLRASERTAQLRMLFVMTMGSLKRYVCVMDVKLLMCTRVHLYLHQNSSQTLPTFPIEYRSRLFEDDGSFHRAFNL